MANSFLFFFFFFYLSILCSSSDTWSLKTSINKWNPIQCSHPSPVPTCSSYLYVVPRGRSPSNIAAVFSANASLIETVTRPSGTVDLLVQVPCGCEAAVGVDDGAVYTALFHNTNYTVKAGDTATNVTETVFSGLAWNLKENLTAENTVTVNLPCSCSTYNSGHLAASYAVQDGDTLTIIAMLLDSDVEVIEKVNFNATANLNFIRPGMLLFVPMGIKASPPPPSKKGDQYSAILLHRKRRSDGKNMEEIPKKRLGNNLSISIAALESHYLPNKNLEGFQQFESERPVVFSLEAVEEATANFDEKRKIGEGGYGSVYHGILGKQEVAIKKMKACKSKEFFAELKVLCKVHHINVVELNGYTAGDDHLYLVYEYVQNGSLSDHLHDPLLKGHQPLSWNARIQIALDTARGIEYIHDHTKACYVHRDIKTSNILLDNGLRAKVADFGLAKLVERSDEEECFATRLVGTPGYLPPESVLELQMTTKTDIFAFGVVLAELITGYRALIRENKEPSKMKSLVSIMKKVLEDDDPQISLEAMIDNNLNSNYPIEEVHKMVDIALWCLRDDPVERPEMRDIMAILSQIHLASIEWEASLGGNSEVFSGIFNGR
ncbi:lysM domain receptor-like kinase 3 [Typha latifolia]|uniref:lysM domain receptor-like kinase 3 n=1 Tax=Typha latifolia TaxID=4733 RepID=UPI003C2C04EB